MVSRSRFRLPRSKTRQQAITHWRRSAADASSHSPESEQRPSKPGGPECARRSVSEHDDLAGSQGGAHASGGHEARANNWNDASAIERCNACGWNQTSVTHQIRHHAPRVSKPRPPSSEQRRASRCHEARLVRMPKRIGEAAPPNQTPVFERHPT